MASGKQKQLQTSFGLEAFNLKPYPQPAKFNSWQSAILEGVAKIFTKCVKRVIIFFSGVTMGQRFMTHIDGRRFRNCSSAMEHEYQ